MIHGTPDRNRQVAMSRTCDSPDALDGSLAQSSPTLTQRDAVGLCPSSVDHPVLWTNGDRRIMFRIALCDDDPGDLDYYEKKILKYAGERKPDTKILKYQTPAQLLFALSDVQDLADVIFLDIHMPELDGIALAEKIRDAGYRGEIVFLTVSEEDMLRAFDVRAFNYILKGKTSEERFRRVLYSVMDASSKKQSASVMLSSGGESINLPISDIIYFEVSDHLIVAYFGKETFSFISTIGKLENRLRHYGFIRIHRSFLVSGSYIERFDRKQVVLKDGRRLPVSRNRYADLKDSLRQEESRDFD